MRSDIEGHVREASEMGDAVNRMNKALRYQLGLAAALGAAVFLTGCASARPEAGAEVAEVQDSASATKPATVRLSRLEVIEGAPGTRIEVAATGALVWTTYRDLDGNLVVELPNTELADGVADSAPANGLVSAVRISQEGSGDRPMTRLVITTREEAEHSLAAAGRGLSIDLVASATVPATATRAAAAEPVSAPAEPMAPMAPMMPAAAEPQPARAAVEPAPSALGTADHPAFAPAPSGRIATRLDGVEVLADGARARIRIAGDGEFAFSTFRLENPDRFVIDLDGAVNATSRGVWTLDGAAVSRVRVSQFKPQPQPVSRVVFDLAGQEAPTVERTANGLLIRFGEPTAPGQTTLAEDLGRPTPASTVEAVTAWEDAPVAAVEPEPASVQAAASPEPAALATSDVAAFGSPAVAPPARRAEPPPTVAAFEAADVQAPAPTPRAESSSPAYEKQTVGGQRKVYVGEAISLDLKDADVRDVLRSFAKISGLNIVVQPGVRGTVTVVLESVPWDQALDQILKINGLGYELDGNIMRIAPVTILEAEARRAQALAQAQALSVPLRTVVKRLSYSTAQQMARILQSGSRAAGGGLLSQRGTVTVDNRTNTLIIKELPNYIDTVIAVIETLDIPEPQVMIEARIVETTKRFSRSLGIRWGFDAIADAAHGNTTGLVFPNNVDASGGVSLLTGGANGFVDLALGNVLNTFNLDARLQAAEGEGLINVLSAPKIATLNNESATIQSGLQIPIQTVANNTVSVQFVNATLRLQVTPHVTAEGTVLMDINIQKREPQLAFAVVGATNAPIATKEAQTRVIVRDGGTTVIGGIYEVSTDQGQDRVPGLSNVPLLGHLFKNKRRQDENEELLIFITPRVIKL